MFLGIPHMERNMSNMSVQWQNNNNTNEKCRRKKNVTVFRVSFHFMYVCERKTNLIIDQPIERGVQRFHTESLLYYYYYYYIVISIFVITYNILLLLLLLREHYCFSPSIQYSKIIIIIISTNINKNLSKCWLAYTINWDILYI